MINVCWVMLASLIVYVRLFVSRCSSSSPHFFRSYSRETYKNEKQNIYSLREASKIDEKADIFLHHAAWCARLLILFLWCISPLFPRQTFMMGRWKNPNANSSLAVAGLNREYFWTWTWKWYGLINQSISLHLIDKGLVYVEYGVSWNSILN